jgi:hypothetical protein
VGWTTARRTAEDRPAMYAVEVSPWSRCDAEASPGRGYLYPPFSPLRGPTHRAVVSGGPVLSNARFEKKLTLYDVKMRQMFFKDVVFSFMEGPSKGSGAKRLRK